MKKNLAFETPQVESSFGTGIFIRNLDIIKLSIYIHLIFNFFKIYSEWVDVHWIISIFRLIISFLVFSTCIAILNLNKFESTYYIRFFLQIDTIINILIKTKICYGNPFSVMRNSIPNNQNTISNVFQIIANNTSIINESTANSVNNSIRFNTINENYNEISNLTSNILRQKSLTDNIYFQRNIQSN